MVATSTPELKRLGEEADIRSAKQNRKQSPVRDRRILAIFVDNNYIIAIIIYNIIT